MRIIKHLALAVALALAAGCGSDSSKPGVSTPDGGNAGNPDGGSSSGHDGGSPTPDGGSGSLPDGGMVSPDGGPAAIKLVDWVSDLVTNYSKPESTPDTVDDKNVTDNTDPAAFDTLLGP